MIERLRGVPESVLVPDNIAATPSVLAGPRWLQTQEKG